MNIIDKWIKKLEEKDSSTSKSFTTMTSEEAQKLINSLSGDTKAFQKKLVDNTIVFMSASGGAGASTVLANVAWQKAKEGLRVLVIDASINFPVQHTFFKTKQEISEADLVSYLMGKNPAGESIKIMGNISLCYANNRSVVDSINCDDSADEVTNNINALVSEFSNMFDLILIDMPLQLEHTVYNQFLFDANRICLIWDESISSVTNSDRIIRNLEACGINAQVSIIMNKRTNVSYSSYPLERFKESRGIDIIQILPFDTAIIQSGLRGEIFCEKGASFSKNSARFCIGIKKIADNMVRTDETVGGAINE